MKKNKIEITQKDGVIEIYRNGELEHLYDFNRGRDNSPIFTANMVAEIINDCLNCKSATSTLTDLNDTKSYRGTYFEDIDRFTF